MAKAGMTGNPPEVKIGPTPTGKRPAEFYVNDIRSTIDRLNAQLAKAAKVGVAIQLSTGVDSAGAVRVTYGAAPRA